MVKTAIGRSFGCPICCILYLHRSSRVVERPSSTTDWQPHRGFSVPSPDICSRSVYLTLIQRSELKNPRFQTHFLTLNPSLRSLRSLDVVNCCHGIRPIDQTSSQTQTLGRRQRGQHKYLASWLCPRAPAACSPPKRWPQH